MGTCGTTGPSQSGCTIDNRYTPSATSANRTRGSQPPRIAMPLDLLCCVQRTHGTAAAKLVVAAPVHDGPNPCSGNPKHVSLAAAHYQTPSVARHSLTQRGHCRSAHYARLYSHISVGRGHRSATPLTVVPDQKSNLQTTGSARTSHTLRTPCPGIPGKGSRQQQRIQRAEFPGHGHTIKNDVSGESRKHGQRDHLVRSS